MTAIFEAVLFRYFLNKLVLKHSETLSPYGWIVVRLATENALRTKIYRRVNRSCWIATLQRWRDTSVTSFFCSEQKPLHFSGLTVNDLQRRWGQSTLHIGTLLPHSIHYSNSPFPLRLRQQRLRLCRDNLQLERPAKTNNCLSIEVIHDEIGY